MTLLHNMDMLSLWEIAHRMHGIPPDEHEDPPSDVGDTLRELLVGTSDVFNPYDSGGNPIGYGIASVFLGRPSKFERRVEKAINERTYDKRWLNSVFIEQDEFEIWCALHNRPLPDFWFSSHWQLSPKAQFYRDSWSRGGIGGTKSEKASPLSLRPVQEDRQRCEALATRLWKEFPSLTIAAMMKRPEIQREGNGKLYKEKALRRWLSSKAPPDIKGKRGRPRKAPDITEK